MEIAMIVANQVVPSVIMDIGILYDSIVIEILEHSVFMLLCYKVHSKSQ